MPHPSSRSSREVPVRGLALSLAALVVPVAGALFFPETLGEYGALLWLLTLVPAFLLAYYRGWRGVASALAVGMATLSSTQAAALWLGKDIPDILLGIVVAYVGIALALGWLADVFHRDMGEVVDLAFTDILTQLPNRRHARMFLENEFAAAERGRLLSVVLFDLDDFKGYNDRHGHAAGDRALEGFAGILRRSTRRMNLSARFGGEEFLSVLADTDAVGAVTFAERVCKAVRSRGVAGESLTVSAGVAQHHPGIRSPDELLAAADHALYQAKRDGRDRVHLFAGSGADRATSPASAVRLAGATGAADYPRAPEEIGRSRPPPTLLPHAAPPALGDHRVLLVEDDDKVRVLMSTYLGREGFSVTACGNVAGGVEALAEEYDVVVTDIGLPDASGNDLVAATKARWPTTPVIVITGLQDAQVAAEALNAGADRYLFKPFGMPELRAHVEDALSRRRRTLADREERSLSAEARERAQRARDAVLRGARALVRAVEVRDAFTRGHARKVAAYAEVLADAADPDEATLDRAALALACELHDVGKIGVPDAILNKPGRLTGEEYRAVRRHPRIGRRILEPLLDDETVLAVVTWHHERWDGGGYPDGLAGEAIPLPARLVALADALEAITSDRAYRPGVPWDEALETLRGLAGEQFDPELVKLLDRVEGRLKRLHAEAQPGLPGPAG